MSTPSPAYSTSLNDTGRVDWIDAARGISILLVVLMHSTAVSSALLGVRIPSPSAIAWINDTAGPMRMPLLFLVSGLLAPHWMRRSWRELFRGKIAHLFWAYLVWQVIGAALSAVGERYQGILGWGRALDLLGTTLLAPTRPQGVLWFLWVLCLFFIAARATRSWPGWVRVRVPLVLSVGWPLVSAVLPPAMNDAMAPYSAVFIYGVFFSVGCTCSSTILRWFCGCGAWTALALTSIWLVTATTINAMNPSIGESPLRLLLSAICVAGGLGLSRLLAGIRGIRTVGQNALPIYVAHMPLLVAVCVGAGALGAAAPAQVVPIVTIVILTVVVIGAAILLYRSSSGTRWGQYLYRPPLISGHGQRPRAA